MRRIVVEMWNGVRRHRGLRFTAVEQPAGVDLMTDAAVTANLVRLKVTPLPIGIAAQRERLKGWPTPADIDAIAAEWTAANGGVKPVVRVLDEAPSLRASGLGRGGAAGSIPR